jgi:hypothetical protein
MLNVRPTCKRNSHCGLNRTIIGLKGIWICVERDIWACLNRTIIGLKGLLFHSPFFVPICTRSPCRKSTIAEQRLPEYHNSLNIPFSNILPSFAIHVTFQALTLSEYIKISGQVYQRNTGNIYDDEYDYLKGVYCHDCGVLYGNAHHIQCDMERCPKCEKQLFGCGHLIGVKPSPFIRWVLYAIHLNDNSLFCVLTNLDVMCSPNNRFITETMVSFFFR